MPVIVHSFVRIPRLLALLLCLALWATGCQEDGASSGTNASEGTLPDGTWVGDFIDFEVVDGKVTNVTVHGVMCSRPHPEFPTLSACQSEVIDGEFSEGLSISNTPNYISGDAEWRISGELGPLTLVDGLFLPMSGPPTDFNTVMGTFYFKPEKCDCAGKLNFQAWYVPPVEEEPIPEQTGEEGTPDPDPSDPINPPVEPPTGGPGTGTGSHPVEATEPQISALDHVNWYRNMVGLTPVDAHEALIAAAMDHCECYSLHKDEYGSLNPHDEDPSWGPPCYGSLMDRLNEKNYTANGYFEVMAFMNHPTKSVDGWIATLYHRLPLLSPTTVEIGYGHAPSCDTIDTGSGSAPDNWNGIFVYPTDGQTGVDTYWNGYESPQPPVPPGGYPSGPIITAQFGGGVNVSVTESYLTDKDGNDVPHTFLTPETDSWLNTDSTVALYSDGPLEAGGVTYTVRLVGTEAGQPWELTWSFETAQSQQGR